MKIPELSAIRPSSEAVGNQRKREIRDKTMKMWIDKKNAWIRYGTVTTKQIKIIRAWEMCRMPIIAHQWILVMPLPSILRLIAYFFWIIPRLHLTASANFLCTWPLVFCSNFIENVGTSPFGRCFSWMCCARADWNFPSSDNFPCSIAFMSESWPLYIFVS